MLRCIGAGPLGEHPARADVRMPWRRLATDKARRRRIRRWLFRIVAVLLVFLAAGLLIWVCTVWSSEQIPDPPDAY